MKANRINSWIVAALALVVMPLLSSSVCAQEGQDEQTGLVAVLDVAKVFKENAQFEQKMAAIKSEADGLKAQIQQEQEAIRSRAQQVSQYEVGSAERNQLEGKIEQEQAALRTRARQAETDLLSREAVIYHETYEQMKKVVGGLAQQYGISLVLRFDSSEINRSNRGEVIKGVNRTVVYHRRLDLTNMVIKEMSPQTASANQTQNQ